jgi:hypothetical protein
MTETEWTAKVCKELEGRGCVVYPIVAQMRGKSGWPDRLIISKYGVWLLEFKGLKTKVQLRQKLIMQMINRIRPGTCWVVRQGSPSACEGALLYPDESDYKTFENCTRLLTHLKDCDKDE